MPRALRKTSHTDPNSPDRAGTSGLSRRTLLRGLTAAGASVFAGRLLGPASALAAPSAVSSALLVSTLEPPVDTAGRLLHGAWIAPGPPVSSTTAWTNALGAYVTQNGYTPAIINFFKSWASQAPATPFTFPGENFNTVLALGAIPMLTWQPKNSDPAVTDQTAYSWTNVKGGAWDAEITAFANKAAAFGHPFLMRFAHEMNTNTYPWGAGVNGNPQNGLPDTSNPAARKAGYAEFFQHVRYIFDNAGASNVLWTWAPNIGASGSTAFTLMSAMYPGDDAVN